MYSLLIIQFQNLVVFCLSSPPNRHYRPVSVNQSQTEHTLLWHLEIPHIFSFHPFFYSISFLWQLSWGAHTGHLGWTKLKRKSRTNYTKLSQQSLAKLSKNAWNLAKFTQKAENQVKFCHNGRNETNFTQNRGNQFEQIQQVKKTNKQTKAKLKTK